MRGESWRLRHLECAGAMVALSVLLWGSGCESAACTQMRACCAEVKEREAVGEACGELIEGIDDAGSCVGVTQSVVAMLREKGDDIPEACRLKGNEK